MSSRAGGSTQQQAGTRWFVIGIALVFAVALALRFGHLAGLRASWSDMHLFSIARGDAALHWDEAVEILEGDFWLTHKVFWKGPGFSYFLAGLMAWAGRSPGDLRWLLALLGALNCAGLVLLARRALSRPASLLAGLLAAGNGIVILYDGELFFPTLLISLNLGALWLITRERAGPAAHAGAGCLLGAAALVHPVYLVPAAALGLWLALRRPLAAVVLVTGIAAVIAPVTLTNVFVRDQPLLISWNGGINVYAGNQPCFDQYSGNRTNAWGRIMATPVDAGIESEHERDRLYYRLAAREGLRAPGRALRTLASKALILFSPVEYASNIGIYELRDHSPVLAATLGRWGPLWYPFGLLAPVALLGLLRMLRERTALTTALGLWSLGLASTIVLSFNSARYRVPLVFFGSIWAAAALAAGWRSWREGRRRPLLAGVSAALLLGLASAMLAEPQHGYPLPLEWEESVALENRGAAAEAEDWVLRALERAPDDPAMRLAAADFFRRHGDRERERDQLQRMLALEDNEPDIVSIGHHYLARSWAADGRIEPVRREMAAALAVAVDETHWRGAPYYQLGLGPLNACWLRLEAAGFEFDAGSPERAAEWMKIVRDECPLSGRLGPRLEELHSRAVLAEPHL